MSDLALAIRCPHGIHYSVGSLIDRPVEHFREFIADGEVYADSTVTFVKSESVRDGTLHVGDCSDCRRLEDANA